jgi:hypothetical protein
MVGSPLTLSVDSYVRAPLRIAPVFLMLLCGQTALRTRVVFGFVVYPMLIGPVTALLAILPRRGVVGTDPLLFDDMHVFVPTAGAAPIGLKAVRHEGMTDAVSV